MKTKYNFLIPIGAILLTLLLFYVLSNFVLVANPDHAPVAANGKGVAKGLSIFAASLKQIFLQIYFSLWSAAISLMGVLLSLSLALKFQKRDSVYLQGIKNAIGINIIAFGLLVFFLIWI
ncbi:MAG: hypothetical protein K1X56_07695 [Flavobacteriales bacterium]|nr:hypothetical protein [Flavobacteriales bacterium]